MFANWKCLIGRHRWHYEHHDERYCTRCGVTEIFRLVDLGSRKAWVRITSKKVGLE